MTKLEVEHRHLGEYVVMPEEINEAFLKWWRSIDPPTKVKVRVPHTRHELAGKTSNSAKTEVLDDFLTFVDSNSQPSGQAADSLGPTSYFLSSFTTFNRTKKSVNNYEERYKRSVVGVFTRAQEERGRSGCSDKTVTAWLRKHRPKVGICPHKLDYCDTCKGK